MLHAVLSHAEMWHAALCHAALWSRIMLRSGMVSGYAAACCAKGLWRSDMLHCGMVICCAVAWRPVDMLCYLTMAIYDAAL